MRKIPATAPLGALLCAALLSAGCADLSGLAPRAIATRADSLASAESLSSARLSPAAWPRTDWWKQYGDPQLDALIGEALAGSPSLRVADARVRKAFAFAQAAGSALYPHVDGSGTITRQRFPQHGLLPPPIAGTTRTQPQVQATLGYETDFWGRNRAAYDSALGQAKAAEIDAFAARLALSVNIAQAYVQFGRAWLQLDVAEKSLRQREQFYKLTLERFDNGFDTRLAVKQAEAALPATREQIAALRETIGLQRNQLAALLGKGPDRGLAIDRPATGTLPAVAVPADVPAGLLGRRPDLVAQRWRIEAAAKDIDAAKARFYPDINLTAFIGLQSLGLPGFLTAANRTPGVGSAITLPIFEAGRLRGNLAGADADYDAAVELYNQTLVDALREVVDQLASLRSVEEQRRQQALAETTAREAYDLALLRFREGIGNYLEVITAETQLLAQQSLDVDLRARELGTSINLVRALGGGLEEDTRTGAQP
ncbi:MAG: efflux transporter outer membrane subunit [Proteobacteria bacterium]|nr:efflux transporter outer membrane subunit [Pseudomonadota bacterium]